LGPAYTHPNAAGHDGADCCEHTDERAADGHADRGHGNGDCFGHSSADSHRDGDERDGHRIGDCHARYAYADGDEHAADGDIHALRHADGDADSHADKRAADGHADSHANADHHADRGTAAALRRIGLTLERGRWRLAEGAFFQWT
jgi:hypothetical protein